MQMKDNNMIFNSILNEVVVHDKSSHYSNALLDKSAFYTGGKKVHTTEKIDTHILTFPSFKKDGKTYVKPQYIRVSSIHTPQKVKGFLNKMTELRQMRNTTYKSEFLSDRGAKYDRKTFNTFADIHEFAKKEYNKNPWINKLIQRYITKAKKIDNEGMLDRIIPEQLLQQSIKLLVAKNNGKILLQDFAIIRDTPNHKKNDYKYPIIFPETIDKIRKNINN